MVFRQWQAAIPERGFPIRWALRCLSRRPRERVMSAAQRGEVHAELGRLLESRRWSWEFGETKEAGIHSTEFQTELHWEKTLEGPLEDSTMYRSARMRKLPPKRTNQNDLKKIVPPAHTGPRRVPTSAVQTGTGAAVGEDRSQTGQRLETHLMHRKRMTWKERTGSK